MGAVYPQKSLCKSDHSPVFGLFRQNGFPDLRIYSFNPETATWDCVESHIKLRKDIIQIVLVPGHMIALTTSGSVLLRKMEKTQTELFVIGNNCQKLIQGGHQCFGFFEDRGEIIVRRFDPYLGIMENLEIRMADHFDSSTRVDAAGNVSLYIAGEDFEFLENAAPRRPFIRDAVLHTQQTFGPGLLLVQIDCSGHMRGSQFHDLILERGCVLDISSNILSLWMKGFREVVKLNANTLSIEWVEWIAHERPLADHLLHRDEAISLFIQNTQFLFHRRFRKSTGFADLITYKLQLSEKNNRRYWNHVSSFLRVELVSVFDGRFALHCERF